MSSETRSAVLSGRRGPRGLLAPPLVPGAGEVVRSSRCELEHRGRDRLEEPAVVGDKDHRRIQGRELCLQPFQALDVEVVRRLVEEEEVGIDCQRTGQRSARQLSSRERRELPVEVGVLEAEAATARAARSRQAQPPACSSRDWASA